MDRINMQAKELLLYLSRVSHVHSPHTKDTVYITMAGSDTATIRYRLILYDEYSDEIGRLDAEAVISGTQPLRSADINRCVDSLGRWGRELFNKEAQKHQIRMYIPGCETIAIYGNVNAA